jgi:hypothetical protein
MEFFSIAAELASGFADNVVSTGTRMISEVADKVKAVEQAVENTAGQVGHASLNTLDTAKATVAKTEGKIADAANRTAGTVASKTIAAAKAAAEKARKAAAFLKKALKRMSNKAVNVAVSTCHAAKRTAGTVKNAVVNASNTTINTVGGTAASVLTASKTVESAAVRLLEATEMKGIDGCFLDENCRPSRSLPKRGKRPACGGYDGIPKVMYTNGINTEEETCCDTMRKLAESRCVEVVGVYNATNGTMPDVAECVQNINRAGTTPAVKTQVAFLEEQLADPAQHEITLFAHSQGGLITQESLVKLRNDLTIKYMIGPPPEPAAAAGAHAETEMSRVTVNSFGTAEEGWPKGPVYNRFTNTKDPVPIVIKSVQANHPDIYGQEPVEGTLHRFSKSHLNPIDSHSMDTVYLDEYNKTLPYDRKGCKCGK